MPAETIDKNAVASICHTSADHARYYTQRANTATLYAALAELDRMARAAAHGGKPVPPFTTLRNQLDARLRKLSKSVVPKKVAGGGDSL